MPLDLPLDSSLDVPPDLWHKLPIPVIYVVGIGIIVSLAVIRLSEVIAASETIAKACGPPGRWWRQRIKDRAAKAKQERLDEMREAFGTPEFRMLQRRIGSLDKMMHIMESEIRVILDTREMDSAYLREDAEWHIRAGVLAAEQNFRLPKHRSYTQFCREWRILHKQPKGDDDNRLKDQGR